MQARKTTPWLTIGQLAASALGGFFSLLIAAGTFANGSTLSPITATSIHENNTFYSIAVLALFLCALHTISLVRAVQRLIGKPHQAPLLKQPYRTATLCLLSWLPIITIGYLISQHKSGWSFMPIINLVSVVIPIWWLVEYSRRRLPRPSSQRTWGIVSTSLSIVPTVIIILEVVIISIAMLTLFILLSPQPIWAERFEQLYRSASSANVDLNVLENFLHALINDPLSASMLFIIVGVVIPLVEEFLKPLALWALASRKPTPAEGFSLGLISGAAFALLESAGLLSQINGTDWAPMVLLRSSTNLLHITASGLVGWGLASVWSQKRYKRAIFSLLAAAAIHGVWNTMAMTIGFSPFLVSPKPGDITLGGGQILIICVMSAELVGMFLLLTKMNLRLRAENATQLPLDNIDS